MTPEEAVQILSKAGLYARHTPEKAFCDIMAVGDPEILVDKTESFQWACWIAHQDANWRVCLPPHQTPGPGPEFIISTLEEAVSLVIFAFARRMSGEELSTRQEFEHAQRTYNEWIQEQKLTFSPC